ncbi:MAG: hypothetical protein M9938_04065 [Solirubrobacterales bacterium]|nr:hypothetical protein [Solirubrobacterales bacterium]
MSLSSPLRSPLRGWVLLAVGAGLALFLLTGGASPAAAKWTQPTCGKFQKQIRQAQKKVRKTKGQAKKKARNQLKAAKYKQRTCANNRMIWNQVKNSRFVGGLFGDGSSTDDTYCANGKWRTGSQVWKTGWMITDSKVKNSRNFVAMLRGNIGAGPTSYYRIGVVRKGNSWELGWMSFDQLQQSGPAVKTDARAECATL